MTHKRPDICMYIFMYNISEYDVKCMYICYNMYVSHIHISIRIYLGAARGSHRVETGRRRHQRTSNLALWNGRRKICQPEYMISTGRNFHKIYIASDNHH